jgi:hypothetical protein
MSCKDIEKYLVDYFDNRLSEEKLKYFNSHLNICSECRVMVDAQKKWLSQHRYELKSQSNLSDEEILKLKRSIMDSVRSSQQAARAAKYISTYQSSSPANIQADQRSETEEIIKRKNSRSWFRPHMFAGYAAMLVLLVVAGFLLKTMIGKDGSSRAVLQGDSAVTQAAAGMNGVFENEAELPEIDDAAGFNDGNEIDETKSEEAFPENAENGGVLPDSDTALTWQVFNGKLTDLAGVSPIFEKREMSQESIETEFTDSTVSTTAETTSIDAVTTVDLLSTAKAIRILTRQNVPDKNDEMIKGAGDPAENPLGDISEILILAAWNNSEISDKLDDLESMLENSQSAHDLQLINNRMMYESILGMIGSEQYELWMEQIEEQDLSSYSWISIKIGG